MKNWICKNCNVTVASFITKCPKCGKPNAPGATVYSRPKPIIGGGGANVKPKYEYTKERKLENA